MKKLIVQKIFFFNYLLSVTIPDIVQTSINQAIYGNTPQDENATDLLERIFKTLQIILDLVKDKNLNQELDQVLGSGNDVVKPLNLDEEEKKQTDDNHEDLDDDENQSTTISLIRLTLFNIECLIRSSQSSLNEHQNFDNKSLKNQKKINFEFFFI